MTAPENGGSLSAAGRFDRMEQALVRIEDKLDHKVDHATLDIVRGRVEVLERGESPMGKMLLQDYAQVKQTLADITLHGSQNAQLAATRVANLEAEVAKLTLFTHTQDTLQHEHRDQWLKTYRMWGVLISVVSASSFVVTMIATLAH